LQPHCNFRLAIRAGLLFEAKAGNLLSNQVVLFRGGRISDVGGHLQIPAGARCAQKWTAQTTCSSWDDAGVRILEQKLPFVPTVDGLIA
jgi:hypothetical protein